MGDDDAVLRQVFSFCLGHLGSSLSYGANADKKKCHLYYTIFLPFHFSCIMKRSSPKGQLDYPIPLSCLSPLFRFDCMVFVWGDSGGFFFFWSGGLFSPIASNLYHTRVSSRSPQKNARRALSIYRPVSQWFAKLLEPPKPGRCKGGLGG